MLAIIAALKEEVRSYIKEARFTAVAEQGVLKFYESASGRDTVLATGGVGARLAQEAASYVIERYSPEAVISVGFSGAVMDGLETGDVLICDRLLSVGGPAVLWRAEDASERPPIDIGVMKELLIGAGETWDACETAGCLSVPELVSNSSMKAWIGREFPVAVVDMESYWVSEKCAEYGTPHVAVRSVFDPVDQTLPPFVGEAMFESNVRRLGRAMKYVATNPSEAPRLFNLASQSKAASASLGSFLCSIGRGIR